MNKSRLKLLLVALLLFFCNHLALAQGVWISRDFYEFAPWELYGYADMEIDYYSEIYFGAAIDTWLYDGYYNLLDEDSDTNRYHAYVEVWASTEPDSGYQMEIEYWIDHIYWPESPQPDDGNEELQPNHGPLAVSLSTAAPREWELYRWETLYASTPAIVVGLNELSFNSDHTLYHWDPNAQNRFQYSDPAWRNSPFRSYPIAYTTGALPSLNVKLHVQPPPPAGWTNVRIAATWDAADSIPSDSVELDDGLEVSVDFGSAIHSNTVLTDNYDIDWYISYDGGEWTYLGSSGSHKVYWTLHDPPTGALFVDIEGTGYSELYDTALDFVGLQRNLWVNFRKKQAAKEETAAPGLVAAGLRAHAGMRSIPAWNSAALCTSTSACFAMS